MHIDQTLNNMVGSSKRLTRTKTKLVSMYHYVKNGEGAYTMARENGPATTAPTATTTTATTRTTTTSTIMTTTATRLHQPYTIPILESRGRSSPLTNFHLHLDLIPLKRHMLPKKTW